jgi:hypothetical protein
MYISKKHVHKTPKSVHIYIYAIIDAPQQMCNMLHKNLKEKTMFDFEKQYKDAVEKFETVTKQSKQAYEFWYNIVMDTWKDLYSKKK